MANLEDARRRSTKRASTPAMSLRLNRFQIWLEPKLPGLIAIILLFLWEILARAGVISQLFFPPPSRIVRTLYDLLISGKLMLHLVATLERLGPGVLVGGVAGLILGLIMGWSSRIRTVLDPIIAAIHPIPKLAIFPLIMIIFGIGEISKVIAIAIACFFPMLINSMAGVRQLSPVFFEVSRNYGASPWKTFTRIIIPGSLPMVLTGARLAINMAMVISISVELLAAKEGLGVIIWFSWQTMRIEDLYASLIVIAALGISLNLLLQHLSHRLVPWYSDQSSKSA
jgi:ABC-type nitrate/sulfonate/bicarbonate transport system permease component